MRCLSSLFLFTTLVWGGESEDQSRILGGVKTVPGELNYQVSVRYRQLHVCGGSLVQVDGIQVVLTAAHCTSPYISRDEDGTLVIQDLTVHAGDHKLSDRTGVEQERVVVKVVNHEKFVYNLSLIAYDISLLFLNESFVLNAYVNTISLPGAFQDVVVGRLLVSGWGIYDGQGYISDNLTKLEVPLVPHEACRQAYLPIVKDFYNHLLCFGGNGKAGIRCKGDSGGPVVSLEKRQLVGVISWGAGCGNPRFPTVSTKVSFFTDWINENVKKQQQVPGDGGDDESDEDN